MKTSRPDARFGCLTANRSECPPNGPPTAIAFKQSVHAVFRIEKKSGPFEATTLGDHYGTALKELVQEKMKAHKVAAKEVERPSGGNVVDLMEALKRSIGG